MGRIAALLGLGPRSSTTRTSPRPLAGGALVGRRLARVRPDPVPCSRSCCSRCRCATLPRPAPGRARLRGARGRADVRRLRRLRELRAARRDDVPRLVVPRLLRDGDLGRPRRLHHPVGRRVLGLARARRRRSSRTTQHVFTVLSFAFPVPGEHAAANLGVPDLFFFALFLGAADRFGLRVYWTWLALVAALGATIALTVWLNLSGLPALPAISIGFLLPNADLLWRRLRGQPGPGDRPDVAVDRAPDDG